MIFLFLLSLYIVVPSRVGFFIAVKAGVFFSKKNRLQLFKNEVYE
jgi:hypothetical protein